MQTREEFEQRLEHACKDAGWNCAEGVVEIGLPGDRRQRIHVDLFEFDGNLLARFYTTVGDARRVDPARLHHALRLNAGLAHGALAIKQDDLVMVDTLPIEGVPAHSIVAKLRYLAETADHFERTLFGPDRH